MFIVKEIGCRLGISHTILRVGSSGCVYLTSIERVQSHGLELFPLPERRTSPFPNTTHLALATKAVAVCRDGCGMPVLESNIGPIQVEEEVTLSFLGQLSRTSCWWRLLDTVVDEVTGGNTLANVCNGTRISLEEHTHSQQELSSQASVPPLPSSGYRREHKCFESPRMWVYAHPSKKRSLTAHCTKPKLASPGHTPKEQDRIQSEQPCLSRRSLAMTRHRCDRSYKSAHSSHAH